MPELTAIGRPKGPVISDPPRMSHCRISKTEGDELLTVAVHGEFDLAAVPEFHAAVAGVVPPHAQLVVDLRPLTFMDARGMHELVALSERAQKDGFELTIVAPRKPAYRVLELTGTDERLPLVGA